MSFLRTGNKKSMLWPSNAASVESGWTPTTETKVPSTQATLSSIRTSLISSSRHSTGSRAPNKSLLSTSRLHLLSSGSRAPDKSLLSTSRLHLLRTDSKFLHNTLNRTTTSRNRPGQTGWASQDSYCLSLLFFLDGFLLLDG